MKTLISFVAFSLGYLGFILVGDAEPPTVGLGSDRELRVDAGWDAARFPDHAICHLSPQEIAAVYAKGLRGERSPFTSYEKPDDGSLRIVATGHSFMAPAFRTFPHITQAAGLKQPPLVTHTGGGVTGSARYKWEQENGIFQFDRNPTPKLLASISNAKWDAMLWGPYYHDRPEYYTCWIDFCLKYNPDMKFYMMNAWPQIAQLKTRPASEDVLTAELIAEMGDVKQESFAKVIRKLDEKYPGKVFVLPTCEAMVIAADYYHQGKLPGVEGIHTLVGKKQRSFWRDQIGHLGPGFETLEGYVFYAAIYGKSPEHIKAEINFPGVRDHPSKELDKAFRKIAWEAVQKNPLTKIKDENNNGIADNRE